MLANRLVKQLFLSITVLLSGCAMLDKLSAPSLNGDPTSSALVVVKTDAIMHGVFDIITSQDVLSGVLLSTDGSRRVNGSAVAGLIIFSDVPSGEYNLARVQTNWIVGNMRWQHTYNVPPAMALNFIINTKIGEPQYLGVVTVEEMRKTDQRNVIFDLKQSKEAEISAWEKFSDLYQGSPWALKVQQKLTELRR